MYAIVMAGGSGTRFWPLSRSHRPKQLLNISGENPMLMETCNRVNPLVPDEKMVIVLGKNHLKETQELFQGRKISILAEPVGKNTAPCIGLGAIYARHLGCDEPIAFLPADHFIASPSSFLESLEASGRLAESGGIVTLGIVPARPETGYGYIRREATPVDSSGLPAYKVSAFVEKPDFETAKSYLFSGDYLWNAGIFISTCETILKEIEDQLPDLFRGLMDLERSLGTRSFETTLKEVYESLSPVSFDYGVMENATSPIYVVPAECGWSDVGSWLSLYELRQGDYDINGNLSEGETLLVDCNNSYISGRSGRFVACLGMDHCIVVDTEDALLVGDLERSQDIRKIVEQLKKMKKEALL
jgi:mannose-1-phosphate guanylyltransferase